jgi:hypothetical protein
LHLSRPALLTALRDGHSDDSIASHYVASSDMVRFRRSVTGVDRQLRAGSLGPDDGAALPRCPHPLPSVAHWCHTAARRRPRPPAANEQVGSYSCDLSSSVCRGQADGVRPGNWSQFSGDSRGAASAHVCSCGDRLRRCR